MPIRLSKTIQFSERKLIVSIACIANTELFAVYWVRKHFEQVHVGANEPAFQVPALGGGGWLPATGL